MGALYNNVLFIYRNAVVPGGVIYGMYVMVGLSEGRTEFFSDGKASGIEFNISLVKVSEDLRERLAEMEFSDLVDVLPVKM